MPYGISPTSRALTAHSISSLSLYHTAIHSTGLMTTLLAPHCSSVVAVDASSRMLERFSAKLSEADSKIKEKITLLRADLIPDSSSAAGERGEGVEQLEGQKLDVIVVSVLSRLISYSRTSLPSFSRRKGPKVD